jgi:hypothetical protein
LSFQLFAVKAGDRGLGFSFGRHLHESESSRYAAEFVRDDFGGCDLPKGFKSLSQTFFGNLVCQIAYVDIHSDSLLISFS